MRMAIQNKPSTKGHPFQILEVASVIAPITTGPIHDDALLTTPKRPKNKFSLPFGINSANMVCCHAQMGAMNIPDQTLNTHNSDFVYYTHQYLVGLIFSKSMCVYLDSKIIKCDTK